MQNRLADRSQWRVDSSFSMAWQLTSHFHFAILRVISLERSGQATGRGKDPGG